MAGNKREERRKVTPHVNYVIQTWKVQQKE